MKCSEQWLREWVNPKVNTEQLVEALIHQGIEADIVSADNDDAVIEVKLTANRGDCLSVQGLAREIACKYQLSIKSPVFKKSRPALKNKLRLENHSPQACPRYFCRIIENIDIRVKTPDWMQTRLAKSGVRLVCPVVDVMNYVMLELGQPLHAFDLSKIEGGFSIRFANQEKFIALNGQALSLGKEVLVIADQKKILAMAGIIGGELSSVSTDTHSIVLESAFFSAPFLAGKARAYGLQTESAHRFERGVDYTLPKIAIERATALLLSITGGKAGPLVESLSRKYLPKTRRIRLHLERIKQMLGIPIPFKKVERILKTLGMTLKKGRGHWDVMPPAYRFDISLEIDLIEEIGRIYGLEHIPVRLPVLPIKALNPPLWKRSLMHLQVALQTRAYQEAFTYSFVDGSIQQHLSSLKSKILDHPIASQLNVMRTTLFSSLLPILQFNQKHQQSRVRLFEIGRCFISTDSNHFMERLTLTALAWGSTWPEGWANTYKKVDFYDLKGDIEFLFRELTFQYKPIDPQHELYLFFHPGKSAALWLNSDCVGVLGEWHPRLESLFNLKKVCGFELNLEKLLTIHPILFKRFSKFPSVRRDLALEVPKHKNVSEICDSIKKSAGSLLSEIVVFDIYTGEKLSPLYKSIALGLIFQAEDRTLVDIEIQALVKNVCKMLESVGIELRK